MIKHGPSTISGPVSRAKKQWNGEKKKAKPSKRRREDAPIRQDLVNRVRKEIAEGKYDSDEKMQIALDKMLEENGLA